MSAKTNFKAAVKKAKALYKTGRYKKWSDALKAGFNSAARTPAKRKRKTAKPAKRRRVATVKRVTRVKRRLAPAVSRLAGAELSLGRAYAAYVKADTVSDTKKASKRIKAEKERIRKIIKSK